jgi:hypothetical protein
MKSVYTFVVRKLKGRKPLWAQNMDKLEEKVDQIQVTQDRVQWQAQLGIVNILVPYR